MRATGLILFLVISFGSIASAEKVKTNQEAKLFNHPGEQGAVLLHLKEGATMTLLSEEGRWLKVRVKGRTGFIPRSKVDMPDKDEIARNTRRRPFVDGRGTKRGFGGGEGPDDRIGADALGDTSSKGDDDDDAKKPAAKKPAARGDDDDDDDSAKKPAAKKPAVKKPAAKGDDDDDDDDSAKKPAAKKPAVKKPAVKKPVAKGDDDDDDDSAKKPSSKKVAAKGDDDDDDAKKSKGDDDDAKKSKGDDDDAKKSKGDDDDASAGDDDASAGDDDAKRPKAHVSGKTKFYDERTKSSSVSFVGKPGDNLYIAETKGDWTRVEDDEGDTGWALSAGLDVDGPSGGGNARTTTIDVTGRAGVTFIGQGMRSVGSTKTTGDLVPDAYNISASAATIAIGGSLLVPYGKRAFLGGELTYDGSKTVGGGIYYMMVKTGFTIHDVNLRALAAYDFQRPSGMLLVGHLGFRYRAYLVDDYGDATKNPAKIPQETLKAPTLGVALAMPTLTNKVGLQFGLDTILAGASIAQTAGLEDGANPTMKDFELSVRAVYRWKKDMNLEASYELDYGSYDFGGPDMQSTRGHTGTDTTRTDILHMVTFGIVKGF